MNVGTIAKGLPKLLLKAKSARPEIFMIMGIAGIIGGSVWACKRTLHLDQILTDAKADLDRINLEKYSSEYTAEMAKKDMTTVYTRSAVKIAKLYALPVVVTAAGIISIVGGNRVLRKEYLALSGAFASLTEIFQKYRQRVIEEQGIDKDRAYRYGVTKQEIEVIDKKGRVKTELIDVVTPTADDLYTAIFKEGNPNWTGHAILDLGFLNTQMQFLTDRLVARGYLTLAEVFEALGFRAKIKEYPAALYIGWVYGGTGDDYVSCGLDGYKDAEGIDVLKTIDGDIALEFNVNGPIEQLLNELRYQRQLANPKT